MVWDFQPFKNFPQFVAFVCVCVCVCVFSFIGVSRKLIQLGMACPSMIPGAWSVLSALSPQPQAHCKYTACSGLEWSGPLRP